MGHARGRTRDSRGPRDNGDISNWLIRVGIWRYITLSGSVMHDNGIIAKNDGVRMRVELHATVDHFGTVIMLASQCILIQRGRSPL